MAEVLAEAHDPAALGYVAQFLTGVARSAHDDALETAAVALARCGGASVAEITRLSGLVQARLAAGAAF
jgi:hypothetical protein